MEVSVSESVSLRWITEAQGLRHNWYFIFLLEKVNQTTTEKLNYTETNAKDPFISVLCGRLRGLLTPIIVVRKAASRWVRHPQSLGPPTEGGKLLYVSVVWNSSCDQSTCAECIFFLMKHLQTEQMFLNILKLVYSCVGALLRFLHVTSRNTDHVTVEAFILSSADLRRGSVCADSVDPHGLCRQNISARLEQTRWDFTLIKYKCRPSLTVSWIKTQKPPAEKNLQLIRVWG